MSVFVSQYQNFKNQRSVLFFYH